MLPIIQKKNSRYFWTWTCTSLNVRNLCERVTVKNQNVCYNQRPNVRLNVLEIEKNKIECHIKNKWVKKLKITYSNFSKIVVYEEFFFFSFLFKIIWRYIVLIDDTVEMLKITLVKQITTMIVSCNKIIN